MEKFSFEDTGSYFIARDKAGFYLIDVNWADEWGNLQLGFVSGKFEEHTIFRDLSAENLKIHIDMDLPNQEYDIFKVETKTIYNFTKV